MDEPAPRGGPVGTASAKASLIATAKSLWRLRGLARNTASLAELTESQGAHGWRAAREGAHRRNGQGVAAASTIPKIADQTTRDWNTADRQGCRAQTEIARLRVALALAMRMHDVPGHATGYAKERCGQQSESSARGCSAGVGSNHPPARSCHPRHPPLQAVQNRTVGRSCQAQETRYRAVLRESPLLLQRLTLNAAAAS
jgi:hypothetical protein